MKKNSILKTKIIILMIFIINLSFTSLFTINLNLECNSTNLDNEKLRGSKISRKIHINGTLDWIDFRNAGNCTGEGTYTNPYVIEDLIIDGEGTGSCILIENSNVYFRIENCTVFNSGWDNSGIRLSYVNNSQLINNNCSSSEFGIFLYSSKNNTIIGNTADYTWDGIRLSSSDNNTILGNILSHNNNSGINLFNCEKNNISNNVMNKCGLFILGSFEDLSSHNIDTTNLVNAKPLYYYVNEENLNSNNFTNAGQIILVNCNKSLISNLNVSYTSIGISLFYCKNNSILGNYANYNGFGYGIFLDECSNNTISNNQVKYNSLGIFSNSSNNNEISGNSANYNGYGIVLSLSDNNTISGNFANNNFIYGIAVGGNNNLISGNVASYNSGIKMGLFGNIYYGIGIYLGGSNNTILENIANNNNENGIELYLCHNNTLSKNTANKNGENGIELYDCNNNTLSENTVSNNDYVGIYVRQCYNNTISENDVNFNGDYGILLQASGINTILNNTVANNNYYGIYLEDYYYVSCYNNTILGNIVEYNQYGINLENCYNNNILDNIIRSNAQNGINLYQSDNNNIMDNNMTYNGQNGIFLSVSDNNIVSGNIFIGNRFCISEVNCQGNYFENNDCDVIDDDEPPNPDLGPLILGIVSFALLGIALIVTILINRKTRKSLK